MKVVYNWLKEFVPVTASPEELASRLALAGTNIGGIEKGAHGAVIDAEVTSNRPDCLSHLGIAREVGAIYKLPLKFVAPKPATGSAASRPSAIRALVSSLSCDVMPPNATATWPRTPGAAEKPRSATASSPF